MLELLNNLLNQRRSHRWCCCQCCQAKLAVS